MTAENKALKDSLVRLGQLETKEKLVSPGPMVPWWVNLKLTFLL